jgi:predicted membrane channel-forming protein YqfA (hemolysin III family)
MPIKLTPLLAWRIVLLLAGLALIAFSLPLLLVVGVNLPDSRFGLFYVGITLTAGTACIAYSARSRVFFRPAVLLLGILLVLSGVASFSNMLNGSEFIENLAIEIVVIAAGIGCIAIFLRSANR